MSAFRPPCLQPRSGREPNARAHRPLSINTSPCSCLVPDSVSHLAALCLPPPSFRPAGEVESLLDTYDRERKVLPAPVMMWKWGWTRSAETWNGRIAMLALVLLVLLEVTTGQGVLAGLLRLE